MAAKTGLRALLDPAQGVLLLVDHQPAALAGCGCRAPAQVLGAAASLARAAALLGLPVVATTFLAERDGGLDPVLDAAASNGEVLDRFVVNAWEDAAVIDAVKATGRRQLVIAGLGVETAVTMTALDARSEGFDVFVVADGCGGADRETHDLAVTRMVQANVTPVSWRGVIAEWQRDWRRATATQIDEILSAASPRHTGV